MSGRLSSLINRASVQQDVIDFDVEPVASVIAAATVNPTLLHDDVDNAPESVSESLESVVAREFGRADGSAEHPDDHLTDEAPHAPPSSAVVALTAVLLTHKWADASSDDGEVRARAMAQQFFLKRLIARGSAAGERDALEEAWTKHAPGDAPSFASMGRRSRGGPAPVTGMASARGAAPSVDPIIDAEFEDVSGPAPSGMARRDNPTFTDRASVDFPGRPPKRSDPQAPTPVGSRPAAAPSTHSGGGGGGGFSPMGLISAPFALVGQAGSVVLAGLTKAGNVAQNAYVRSRVNGHQVLGAQLDSHAAAVVDLSMKLRAHGMGTLIDQIKGAGVPAAEVFREMRPGGRYDALGKQYDNLMAKPETARAFAELQEHMTQFDRKAQRYAKTGVDLDVDYETPIRQGSEAMLDAVEGMPVKKDGVFKNMQDGLREMVERIAEMMRKLFSKFAPG